MLKVEDLSNNYGDFVAVDKISFHAEKGTVFGLLGPNGAGKSTTINCISGLMQPTSGLAPPTSSSNPWISSPGWSPWYPNHA